MLLNSLKREQLQQNAILIKKKNNSILAFRTLAWESEKMNKLNYLKCLERSIDFRNKINKGSDSVLAFANKS